MQTFGVGMLDFYRSDESKCILLCILLLVQILLCANSAYSVFTGSNILLDTARLSVQHIFFPFFLAENIAFFSLLQQAPITSNLCSFPSLLTNISILGSQITGTEIKFFCYLLILKIVVGMVYTLINSTGAAISTVDDINISSTPTNRVSHELKQIAYMLN